MVCHTFDRKASGSILVLTIVLCSDYTENVTPHCLSTQVYKWVPAIVSETSQNTGGNTAMDKHPIQGRVVILLVASCWVPCDGLASHPGEVVILLVASCWVPCDGLASHPGGSCNTPNYKPSKKSLGHPAKHAQN